MRFGGFLGNAALKDRLRASFDAGKISHSYFISGPLGSGKHTLAQLLAAAMECTADDRPCGVCGPCRKVFSGNHPDVLTVDDPDKKQVPVDLIRQARAEVFIRPNEGHRKIFLIPRAHDMNESAQNALLKILEEPPAYGVFLLLADNPDKLLPTIRSRCSELRLSPLPDRDLLAALEQRCPGQSRDALAAAARQSGGFLGKALTLLEQDAALLPQTVQFSAAYAGRDPLALLELLCSMEKLRRDQLAPILEQWRQLLCDALAARQGAPARSDFAASVAGGRTAASLLTGCQVLKIAIDDCWANVSVANICAGLRVSLKS